MSEQEARKNKGVIYKERTNFIFMRIDQRGTSSHIVSVVADRQREIIDNTDIERVSFAMDSYRNIVYMNFYL